jgi:hypothetical protein
MKETKTPNQVLAVIDQNGKPNEAPPDEMRECCLYWPSTLEDSLAMETWALVAHLAAAISPRPGAKTGAR